MQDRDAQREGGTRTGAVASSRAIGNKSRRSARPSAPQGSELASRLGEQIKALRSAATLSGDAPALCSGISRPMLSRVAHGLDLLLSRLFSDPRSLNDLSVVRAGRGIVVDRLGAGAGFDRELLGNLRSGNLVMAPSLVRVASDAPPCTSFQHRGIKFIYMLTGKVTYGHGARKLQEIGAGHSLLFDASALHGIDAVVEGPVSYLSVVFTLRS